MQNVGQRNAISEISKSKQKLQPLSMVFRLKLGPPLTAFSEKLHITVGCPAM